VALAHWIKTHHSDLPVIPVSGEESPDINPGEIDAFFAKPYDVNDAADYIASASPTAPYRNRLAA